MNNDTKILLTLYREGGTLIRQEEEEKEFVLSQKDLNPSRKFKENEGSKVVRKGSYKLIPVKPEIVTQQIKMTVDAYNYMTSSSCPEWYKDIKGWRKMTARQRLEEHLKRTMLHFNAKKYSYSVIDD